MLFHFIISGEADPSDGLTPATVLAALRECAACGQEIAAEMAIS